MTATTCLIIVIVIVLVDRLAEIARSYSYAAVSNHTR